MNLEELRSVREAERQRGDLQPLRESFYEEAGEYIADLKQRRDRAAAAADDPFSSGEVRRLSDEIDTAEEVVEAVYERRLGKLVERAALAASDMAVDEDGLTAEERALFHDLVDRIRASKHAVFDAIDTDPDAPTPGDDVESDREASNTSPDESAGSQPGDGDGDHVSAADLMGDDTESGHEPSAAVEAPSGPDVVESRESSESPDGHLVDDGADTTGTTPDPSPGTVDERAGDHDRGPSTEPPVDAGGAARGESRGAAGVRDPTADRVTVRITRDVGQILGVDDRQYDLAAEDVVVLPASNAAPLVERGAAERLD